MCEHRAGKIASQTGESVGFSSTVTRKSGRKHLGCTAIPSILPPLMGRKDWKNATQIQYGPPCEDRNTSAASEVSHAPPTHVVRTTSATPEFAGSRLRLFRLELEGDLPSFNLPNVFSPPSTKLRQFLEPRISQFFLQKRSNKLTLTGQDFPQSLSCGLTSAFKQMDCDKQNYKLNYAKKHDKNMK